MGRIDCTFTVFSSQSKNLPGGSKASLLLGCGPTSKLIIGALALTSHILTTP